MTTMSDIDPRALSRATTGDDGPVPSSPPDLADAGTPVSVRTPALPADVRIRPYAGTIDHPGMVATGNAWRTATGFLELVTVEGMDNDYANMANCDPRTDCFIAERDGAMVGYARTAWYDGRDDERRSEIILIPAPGPDRDAIVDALLERAEARAIEVAAGHVTERRRVLSGFSPERDAVLVASHERHGYAVVRRGYEMVRPDLDGIPDVPIPAGLEVRPVRPEHLRAIWEADVEAFRDHFGSSDPSAEAWERFRRDPLADPALWRVAWDGDQVAGQVRSYIDHETNARTGRLTGWTEYISVRRPWRRRGLARALLADSLRAIRDAGMAEAALGVDAGNETGALALYESLGFVVHRADLTFERPMPGYPA
jgi:ribosomal protein S18 acetylase RimI-like enzyme